MKKLTSRELRKLDGGIYSRKLWLTAIVILMIFLCGCLAAWWPAFAVSIQVVVGGMVGALTVFLGANVGSKLVLGKTAQPQVVNPKEDDENL